MRFLYVFDQTQPHYIEDIRQLKTPPTSISRIEIVIGGWGNDSYNHIQSLINKSDTGTTTMLYRNFKAFLEAVRASMPRTTTTRPSYEYIPSRSMAAYASPCRRAPTRRPT